MNLLLTVVLPLAEQVPDPEDVKPGWLGFAVFLLLAAAVAFLAFSLVKQLKKVDFEEKDDDGDGESSNHGSGDDASR